MEVLGNDSDEASTEADEVGEGVDRSSVRQMRAFMNMYIIYNKS